MNEFERKLLDTVKFSDWIASFADPNRTLLSVESYTYSLTKRAIALTSAAPQSFDVVMDSDSEFVIAYMSGAARISDPAIAAPTNGNQVTEFAPGILIQITDQSAGTTFFSRSTPLPLIAGAGGFPFILSSPRIIRPRVTLTVTATAYEAGVTYQDFFYCFHGAKLYYSGPTL